MAKTVNELKVSTHPAPPALPAQPRANYPQFPAFTYICYIYSSCSWDCVQLLSARSHRNLMHTLQDRMRLIDLVLEVRDARIPFSSANPELDALVRHKRRLIVLNKADLAAPDKQQVGGTTVPHADAHVHAHMCLIIPWQSWQYVLVQTILKHCSRSQCGVISCNLLQAVLHRLQKQQLSGLFTSSQKSSSISHLLHSIVQRLKADKPKADMLMIMAVGKAWHCEHASSSASCLDARRGHSFTSRFAKLSTSCSP